MKYQLKKENFILKETKYVSNYEYVDENLTITINKEDFTEEEGADLCAFFSWKYDK